MIRVGYRAQRTAQNQNTSPAEVAARDLTVDGAAGPIGARLYTPQEVERVMGAAGFRAELQSETNIRVLAHPA